jgi:histone deacetylase 6
MHGEWANGFCVVRPPGHHSGAKDKINGFCVLNNVALGARYLQQKHNIQRIAILDYDVHEGDGSHHIFDRDKNILFISVHRYDRGAYYPGGPSGNYTNCGLEEAEGTKLNIPLNTVNKKKKSYDYQAPGDNEYVYLYDRIIHPILKEFDPEFILVSSGFDASRKDYLGGFTVTPNAYFFMTKRLV